MDITDWYCVTVHAGAPAAIVDRPDRELARIDAYPEMLARLRAAEFQPFALRALRFRRFFADELAFWRQFVAGSVRRYRTPQITWKTSL